VSLAADVRRHSASPYSFLIRLVLHVQRTPKSIFLDVEEEVRGQALS